MALDTARGQPYAVKMQQRELVERLLRGLDDHDFDAVVALLSDDVDLQHPAATVRGSKEVAGFFANSLAAFPDGRHEVTTFVQEGDLFAVEGVWRGTHAADMNTPSGRIPPTGKSVATPFAVIGSFVHDRVGSLHIYSDQFGFMAQLGLTDAGGPGS
jgi:predicted ester cyclase